MTPDLERLIAAAGLVPGAEAFDWGLAERTLEMRIPADYRGLLDAGGAGLWFDYLRTYAPTGRYPARNLLESGGEFEDLRFLWSEDISQPPSDLADDARLIPWASTANGERVYWRVLGETPADAYPVYVENADGDLWERFDLTATEFLLGLARGDVRSGFFSEFFLNPDEVFRAYGER
ncbi:hypothetical protein [Promicromonospora soli]